MKVRVAALINLHPKRFSWALWLALLPSCPISSIFDRVLVEVFIDITWRKSKSNCSEQRAMSYIIADCIREPNISLSNSFQPAECLVSSVVFCFHTTSLVFLLNNPRSFFYYHRINLFSTSRLLFCPLQKSFLLPSYFTSKVFVIVDQLCSSDLAFSNTSQRPRTIPLSLCLTTVVRWTKHEIGVLWSVLYQ